MNEEIADTAGAAQLDEDALRLAEERLQAIGTIESEAAGRIRLRLKPELRTPELMNVLQGRLEKHPGVHKVTVNHRTGSITIYFDKHLTREEVLAVTAAGGEIEQKVAAERLKVFGTVVKQAPGRIELKLKPELSTPQLMALFQQTISQVPDVAQVTVDEQTGIAVIEFTQDEVRKERRRSVLQEAELIGGVLFEIPEEGGEGGEGGGYGKLDQQLADLVYRADRAVYKKTGLRFRGQILAGSIAGLGVLQIAIYGISLEMLPGPLLFWIAWDIYHREQKEPPLDASDEAVAAEAPAGAGPVPVPA